MVLITQKIKVMQCRGNKNYDQSVLKIDICLTEIKLIDKHAQLKG